MGVRWFSSVVVVVVAVAARVVGPGTGRGPDPEGIRRASGGLRNCNILQEGPGGFQAGPNVFAVSNVIDCYSIVVGLASTRTGGLDLILHQTNAFVTHA